MRSRDELQADTRSAKRQAAEFAEAAERGGRDAVALRGLAKVTEEIADKYTRKLAR